MTNSTQEFDRKSHWEHIYQTRKPEEVSWHQPTPDTSLNFLKRFKVPKDAEIIDVGCGDSFLVDHLLQRGYYDLTVLDISEAAISRTRDRLGDRAADVRWIVSDIVDFQPLDQYDVWHDRATFHFLTDAQDIQSYLEIAHHALKPNAIMIIGAFSHQGPSKCSGIEIKQYSAETMSDLVGQYFELVDCITVGHVTPNNAVQSFVFCCFRKSEV